MKDTSKQKLVAEVFPIQTPNLPRLSAYLLDVAGGDASTVGGKLSYRLTRTFKGHWVWTERRLVTDAPLETSQIMKVVEDLWEGQPETFRGLRGVDLERGSHP